MDSEVGKTTQGRSVADTGQRGAPAGESQHVADVVAAPPQEVEYGLRVSLTGGGGAAAPETTPPVEYGLRVSPEDAVTPDARRPGIRAYLLAVIVVVLLVPAAAAIMTLTGGSGTAHRAATAAPTTSHRPPVFAPTIGITARVSSKPDVVVTPARDGGLWYQTQRGNLTRLAAETGDVAYAFQTGLPALGLAISGRSLEVLTQAAVVERDRGTGRAQQSLPLPAPTVCCGLTAAAGVHWLSLTSGLARIDISSRAITVQSSPAISGMAGDQTRLWLLGDGTLIPVDAASGRPQTPVTVGDVRLHAIAVGAEAIWGIGTRGSSPVLVRFDADSGTRQLVIPLPGLATAVAVSDRAVWLAIAGIGVQELDPSTNSPVGDPIAVSHPLSLLPATKDRLWVVGRARGVTTFTRLDLHPSL
ncbi:MAG: hypothetical protein QOE17_271 [Gaiellales bacterium]|jgi:hypothetical protein|nr:hypothetical protein [Gaiellales bacterium]